nr:protein BREAKING OF ASYMMETRY IN THE STOMATAL LINEAGE-like isoform X3 [Ipomoea batatas]
MDSGSAPEINRTRFEDNKPGSNPCSDNEKDIQDPSGKPFMPLLTFCKSGNMKDDSVGKGEKNTGIEQRYSRIEEMSGEVSGDERPKSLAALFSIQQMDNRDSISSSSSGHLIVPGGGSMTTSCYDTMSFRSNSTTSTRSFAFPILASDWNGSPMRMADGDRTRRFSRKRGQWRMCFGCYNVNTGSPKKRASENLEGHMRRTAEAYTSNSAKEAYASVPTCYASL